MSQVEKFLIKPIKFRKDINFLRAISVLAVILYHFEINYFKGGWLGVDLFFFISGYLIFNKLYLGLTSGNSYLKSFFIKRFLRLTPSLLMTVIFSTLIFYFYLDPNDFLIHLRSSFYSLLYISNFYYINFDFYNASSSKYLTMLHTWSLSIEEQFYLILPIILIFFIRKSKNLKIVLIILIFSSIFSNNFFDEQQIFYNTFSRFWEFIAGAIYMSYESHIKNKVSFKSKYLGVIIIISSFVFINDNNIHLIYPKIILFTGFVLFLVENYDNNSIINNSFLQTIGNISYSLYLFHQPIIAFIFIQNDKVNQLKNYKILGLIIVMFIVSFLNWYFVEKVLNSIKYFKHFLIFYILVTTFLFLSIFNIPDEYNILNFPNKIFLSKIKDDGIAQQNGKSCNNRSVEETCYFIRNPEYENIYILGDSSLRTLSSAMLNDENFNYYNVIHFTGNDCLFIFNNHPSKNSCPNKSIDSKNAFGYSIKDSIIIYGGRFPRYFSGTGFYNGTVQEINNITTISNLKDEIKNTLIKLNERNNIIILIYPIPEQGWNIPDLFYYKNIPSNSNVTYPSYIWYEREFESRDFLDSISEINSIKIYPSEIFCDSFIKNECVGALNGTMFYSDDDHLNVLGSKLLVEKISKELLNK